MHGEATVNQLTETGARTTWYGARTTVKSDVDRHTHALTPGTTTRAEVATSLQRVPTSRAFMYSVRPRYDRAIF